jgi:hypothetical protein
MADIVDAADPPVDAIPAHVVQAASQHLVRGRREPHPALAKRQAKVVDFERRGRPVGLLPL